jgi:DNA-binding ferritin-like protein (Dps family)
MLGALDFGCVYHWYNDLTVIPTHPQLTRYMYPMTPVELHGGYVIGEERIITKVSGLYGWGDASQHEVHVFDDTGREVENFQSPLLTEDGKTWTELRIAEDRSAAIVRK